MTENQQMTHTRVTNADFVYCIDATGSMTPCIETVKQTAKTLHTDIIKATSARGRTVQQLRIKVIVFRDFSHDGEDAIKESRFFNLPDETDEYEAFVNEIEAVGGGLEPESSLEALHLAINSDWVTPADGVRTRHVIVMFTDAPARRLDDPEYREKASENTLYPKDCPSDLSGILDEWDNPKKMDPRAQRLIFFAPDEEPWGELAETLYQCLFVCTQAGAGLNDVSNDAIINCLGISICGY